MKRLHLPLRHPSRKQKRPRRRLLDLAKSLHAEGDAPTEVMFEEIERLDFKGLKDF